MVDSSPVAAGLASGERYTRATVAPRRSSLASERVKPALHRWGCRADRRVIAGVGVEVFR